jgi:hypothetical protein
VDCKLQCLGLVVVRVLLTMARNTSIGRMVAWMRTGGMSLSDRLRRWRIRGSRGALRDSRSMCRIRNWAVI